MIKRSPLCAEPAELDDLMWEDRLLTRVANEEVEISEQRIAFI